MNELEKVAHKARMLRVQELAGQNMQPVQLEEECRTAEKRAVEKFRELRGGGGKPEWL